MSYNRYWLRDDLTLKLLTWSFHSSPNVEDIESGPPGARLMILEAIFEDTDMLPSSLISILLTEQPI